MECELSRHQLMKWTRIKSSAFRTQASMFFFLFAHNFFTPLSSSSSSLSLSCLAVFVCICECRGVIMRLTVWSAVFVATWDIRGWNDERRRKCLSYISNGRGDSFIIPCYDHLFQLPRHLQASKIGSLFRKVISTAISCSHQQIYHRWWFLKRSKVNAWLYHWYSFLSEPEEQRTGCIHTN